MTTNFFQKNIALWLTFALLFCFFCGITATAAYPVIIDLTVPTSMAENGVYAGNVVTPSVSITFDEYFLAETESIISVQFGLKFDPAKLQPADVYGYTPVTFDETGAAIDGLPYLFGTIAEESRFTCILKDNNTLLCTYFSSTDTSHDITESGVFASFAFRVSDELTIENTSDTKLELTKPHIGVSKKDAEFTLSTTDVNIKLLAPIKAGVLGDTIIGNTTTIVGRHYIDKNSNEPLTMTITRDGEAVEPARGLAISSTFISELITFSEDLYEPGPYTITFTYKNMKAHVYMELQAKVTAPEPTPSPTPTPTTTPEPNTDGDTSGDTAENGEETPEESPSPAPTASPTPTASSTTTPSPAPSASPTPKPTTGTNTGNRPNTGSTLVGSGNTDKEEQATPTPAPSGSADTEASAYPTDTAEHWADANIKYVYDHALMNGYSDGTFQPGNSITRAEFVTVMARFLGLSSNEEAASKFTDCETHWAKGYIGALAAEGIVGGVSETAFAPDSNITREQIAVILSRAFGLTAAEPQKYADDADISSWAYDGVYSVQAAGYMKGDTNGNFLPKASATRAEVATIIYRLHAEKNS